MKTNFIQILTKAQAGDTEAFTVIYNNYFTPVYRYIYMQVREKSLTEDLTQDTFKKALVKINSFKGDKILAWLFTIARHNIIDYYRKNKNKSCFSELNPGQLKVKEKQASTYKVEEEVDKEISWQKVRDRLTQLTVLQREILTLKYMDELTNKEIATITGKSIEAIRQLQSRAIRRLRALL